MHIAYVLIVVETQEEARKINGALPDASETLKVKAVSKNTQLVGTNFKGVRPTIVIERYDKDGEFTQRWRTDHLLKMADTNALFI